MTTRRTRFYWWLGKLILKLDMRYGPFRFGAWLAKKNW